MQQNSNPEGPSCPEHQRQLHHFARMSRQQIGLDQCAPIRAW
jgi:hypothetical protein